VEGVVVEVLVGVEVEYVVFGVEVGF